MNKKKSRFTHENPKPTTVPTPENRRARAAYHWENESLTTAELVETNETARALIAGLHGAEVSTLDLLFNLLMGYTTGGTVPEA